MLHHREAHDLKKVLAIRSVVRTLFLSPVKKATSLPDYVQAQAGIHEKHSNRLLHAAKLTVVSPFVLPDDGLLPFHNIFSVQGLAPLQFLRCDSQFRAPVLRVSRSGAVMLLDLCTNLQAFASAHRSSLNNRGQ
ncbi:hypothetical protein D3C76_1385570 [compost metagenome]